MQSTIKRPDIYDYDRRIALYVKNIESRPDILDEHRRAIFAFDEQIRVEGLSEARRLKYFQTLPKIAARLKVPFEETKRDDVMRVVAEIEGSDFSDETKADYKKVLKRFYKWLRCKDDPDYPNVDFPSEVKWIKANVKARGRRLPEDLPTDEEVGRLIEAAGANLRDRAFFC